MDGMNAGGRAIKLLRPPALVPLAGARRFHGRFSDRFCLILRLNLVIGNCFLCAVRAQRCAGEEKLVLGLTKHAVSLSNAAGWDKPVFPESDMRTFGRPPSYG